MNDFPTQKQIENYRKCYPAGTRIQLDDMPDDPQPIPPGTKGTIMMIDDGGMAVVEWDNGRGLSLALGHDKFHVIPSEKILIGQSGDISEKLHSVTEVAEFIMKYGRSMDVSILDENGNLFISTFGIFVNRIADPEYRKNLLEVLVPMQQGLSDNTEENIGISQF